MFCVASTASARPFRPAARRLAAGRRLRLVCAAGGFRARYSLDVRFGSKTDAVALLQEWVRDIGSQAGLNASNTTLTTGSIGAPESTLELEVQFSSLAELEEFWSAVPAAEHKAWGQRMERFIVHGSPQWHVYRELPAFPDGAPAAAAVGTAAPGRPRSGARAGSRPSSSGGDGGSGAVGGGGSLVLPSDAEIGRYAEPGTAPAPPATQQQTASGLSVVSGEEEAGAILDWKGEPMKINPGDKIPFKFL